MWRLPDHKSHMTLKTLKNRYAKQIKTTKRQHWIEWLENIEGNDIWTANKYVSTDSSDSGKTRIPTLITQRPDSTPLEATTNQEKSTILAKSFFLPPPTNKLIPPDVIYPDLVFPHTPFSQYEVTCTISKLNSYKAPRPDSICNIVYKQCTNTLAPYLTHLFNMAFTYQMF